MALEINSRMIDQAHVSETYYELPKGVTLGELRDALSPGTQLMVRFSSAAVTGQSVSFSVGEERYDLSLLDMYIVTPNGSSSPWVFLNPLSQKFSTVAEESNIPQSLDAALATIFSDKITRHIWISEGDLKVVIASIEKRQKNREAQREFEAQYNQFYDQDLSDLVTAACQSTGLHQFQAGSKLLDNVGHLIFIAVEAEYFTAREREDSLDIHIIAVEMITAFFTAIASIISHRVPQLEQLIAEPDAIGIAFDEYDFLVDGLGPLDLVTVFTKQDGWSIAAPYANCAVQASQVVGNYLQDTLPKEVYPKFVTSLDQAVEQGALRIDRENRIIEAGGLNGILQQQVFVFHDDDTVEHAIETLTACGHPRIGEMVFKFMLFKREIARQYENNEPIVIEW